MKRYISSALVLMCLHFGATAHAQDKSWTDLKARGSFGVGAGYAFHSGEATNLPPVVKEWQVSLNGAYNIVPNLSAVGYVARGFDNETFRSSLGLRMTVWKSGDGRQAAGVGGGYCFHAGDPKGLPKFPHEFEGGAVYGMQISDRLTAGASTYYGADNRTFRSVLGLTYSLTK